MILFSYNMNFIKENIASLIVLVIIAILSLGSFFIDIQTFKDVIENAGVWAPIFYILIKSSTVIFAPLSGTALYVLSVPLFGFWTGFMYSFIGDLLGAIVSFYISRFFGRPVIKYFTGKKNMIYIEKSLTIMSTIKGFVLLRFGTFTMPEVASYAAGLTTIKFLPFITIHMAIDLIPIFSMTLLGLFVDQTLSLWFIAVAIGINVVITAVNLYLFARLLKRELQKEGLLITLPNSSNDTN
jgi:uncharacterized membrane protein YdjX (TVP38/TMEM64 family)